MSTTKPKITVAQYIERQIALCGRSQREIASELGYQNHNVISMIKQGQTKLPLDKVGLMAKALGVDPMYLLRLVMSEYSPKAWETVEQILQTKTSPDGNEKALLDFIRNTLGNSPVDLTIAENKAILGDALKEIQKKDNAKAKATLARYNATPPNLRSSLKGA
jgi:hypothetical protein